MGETWEEKYAEENQMPLKAVEFLCKRMRAEENISDFGSAANWAHKRGVKLDARSTGVAEAYFEELETAPEPVSRPDEGVYNS